DGGHGRQTPRRSRDDGHARGGPSPRLDRGTTLTTAARGPCSLHPPAPRDSQFAVAAFPGTPTPQRLTRGMSNALTLGTRCGSPDVFNPARETLCHQEESEMRNSKGFTLIELMIVVVIIGILAAIAIPNFIAMQNRAKEGSTKSNMHTVQLAAEDYGVQNDGVYSATMDASHVATSLPSTFKNPFDGLTGSGKA